MSVVFNKLSFVKRLEDGSTFSRPQAEALTDAFHQAVCETVATRQDVATLRTGIDHLRAELHNEAGLIRSELKAGLAETRVTTVSVGATIIAVVAAMKYFG